MPTLPLFIATMFNVVVMVIIVCKNSVVPDSKKRLFLTNSGIELK